MQIPYPMNLATNYLGLSLQSPFIVGASPCCDDLEVAQRLQDDGAAALVMRSLFAEQITASRLMPAMRKSSEVPDFAEFAEYQLSPDEYLRQIEQLKRTLSIPVIASLNGHHPGSWIDFAAQLERAGADHRQERWPGCAVQCPASQPVVQSLVPLSNQFVVRGRSIGEQIDAI